MFGKSEWFNEAQGKKILRPAEKKGWAYYGTWAGIILIPFALVYFIATLPQAIIWLVAASAVFAFDYRQVLNQKRNSEAYDKLFFIGEDAEVVTAETDNYEIHIKD